MLPLIRKFKAGPLEAEFEREVLELRSSVEVRNKADLVDQKKQLALVTRLAEINPRSAILEAWREFELCSRRALLELKSGITEEQLISTREVIRLLSAHGLLSPEEGALLNQMRFLRNQAVHLESFEPTQEAAINFAMLAAHLNKRLSLSKSTDFTEK